MMKEQDDLTQLFSQPKYRLFPCIFCTLGYNTYVTAFKAYDLTAKAIKAIKPAEPAASCSLTQPENNKIKHQA